MIFAAARFIGHDAFENGGNGISRDAQTRFFENFADNGVFQALTGFHQTTGEGPAAYQRRLAALYEQDPPVIERAVKDQRADPQQRTSWEPAGIVFAHAY
jgi:hypothetical protein